MSNRASASVDVSGSVPRHKRADRLVCALLRSIAGGEHFEGQRFLTRRAIQGRWGVADKVALAALAALKGAGILVSTGPKTVILANGAIAMARNCSLCGPSVAPLPEQVEDASCGDAGAASFRYRRLGVSLLSEISSGAWSAGRSFLSRRAIERMWGVSRSTADSARELLVGHGVLYRAANGRLCVAGDAPDSAALLLKHWGDVGLEAMPGWKLRRNRLVHSASESDRALRLAVVHTSKTFSASNLQQAMRQGDLERVVSFRGAHRHLAGFQAAANDHHCSTSFHYFDGSPAAGDRLVDVLTGRKSGAGGVDGVALMSMRHEPNAERLLVALQRAGISVVCAMDAYQGLGDTVIECNETSAGFIAAKRLLDHGHRAIIVVTKKSTHEPFLQRRYNGVLAAVSQSRLAGEVTLTTFRVHDPEDAEGVLCHLRSNQSPPPTAILFIDIKALANIDQPLWDAGIRFPQTVSAVTCGPQVIHSDYYGPIDTVDRDRVRLGQATAVSLIQILHGNSVPRSIQLDTPYLDRGTVVATASRFK